MSDIDFDELDRAVASVLSGNKTKPSLKASSPNFDPEVARPAMPDPAPTQGSLATRSEPTSFDPVLAAALAEPSESSELTSAESESDAPPSEPSIIVAPPEPLLTPEAGATPVLEPKSAPVVSLPLDSPKAGDISSQDPVATKDFHSRPIKPVQRGRFLDMIHPSHAAAQRPATVSHQAAPVASRMNQTFVSDIVAPHPTTPPAAFQPTVEPVMAPTPIADGTHASLDEPSAIPAPETPAVQGEPVDFFAGSPTESTAKAAEPLASPFIADAKVEKRPLGAFSEATPLPVGDALHQRLVQVESEDNIIDTAESPIPSRFDQSALSLKSEVSKVSEVVKKIEEKVQKPAKPPKPQKSHKNASPIAPKLRSVKTVKRHRSLVIWITVGIVVLLIGIGVGATLYFAVLQ